MLRQVDANVDRILTAELAVNVSLAFGTFLIASDVNVMDMLRVVIPRLGLVSIVAIIQLGTIAIVATTHTMVIPESVQIFHAELVLVRVSFCNVVCTS